MYQVVIAEDESIIRHGIAHLVDWGAFGCEVAFLAEDGEKALAYIRDHRVDILLTDIKMPHVNGLDLIRETRAISEDIVSFIISGYDDFEYAKSAIQYSVSGYIMKPIEEPQLQDLLQKALAILEKRAQHRAVELDMAESKRKNRALARERLFGSVFFSSSNRVFHADALQSLGLNETTCYGVYIFEVAGDLPADTREKVTRAAEGATLVEIQPDLWAAVVCGSDTLAVAEQIVKFKTLLLQYVARRSILDAGTGDIHARLEGLRLSFREAVIDFNSKKSKAILQNYGVETKSKMDFKEKCERIITYVVRKKPGLPEYLDLIEEELLMTGERCAENANVLLSGVYALIISFLLNREDYVDSKALLELNTNYEKTIRAIDVHRKIQFLLGLLESFSTLLTSAEKGKWGKEINLAIAYIEKNYYNKVMDVKEIADYVGMNHRYFSMIFKDKVGKSVMKYLIDYRIFIAKQLLMDKDLKAYQVAEMVGYDSYPYFSVLFRRMTGENPGTYAEKILSTHAEVNAEDMDLAGPIPSNCEK